MSTEEPRRILVVEDQPNWQQVLSDILRHEGYSVQIASTAVEARTHLDSLCFSVVVIDVRLVDAYPYGVQGLEIMRVAKQRGCKVVVLTGFAMPGLREKTAEIGADYFLEKEPDFDVGKFREVLASLMHSNSLRSSNRRLGGREANGIE